MPPSCNSSFPRFDLPAPGHLTQSDYAPHAILMMAVRHHFTGTVQPSIFRRTRRGGRPCPPAFSGFLCTQRNAFLNPFFSFSARTFCAPILFFLFWRKKRTAAPGEEKKENFRNRKFSPCRHHVTAQSPSLICPPQITPNCDPAQRSQFGKEEGASGYGAFAASAEAECSWLLLTPRRTLS